jgi:hypothetical protein
MVDELQHRQRIPLTKLRTFKVKGKVASVFNYHCILKTYEGVEV